MGRATAVNGVVARLKKRISGHLRVDALILVGPRAEGAGDETSDYDLIVVSPDFEGMLREKGSFYDFLCYTPKEFQELSSQPTTVAAAAREGVRII